MKVGLMSFTRSLGPCVPRPLVEGAGDIGVATPGNTRSNTASGSCAQGRAAHTSKDRHRKVSFVAREQKEVAAFVCEDEPSEECS